MRAWLGLWLGLCALCLATSAAADLPAEGQLIRTNRYAIDLYQGPVLASSRVTGLAGSFVAMAEGVDGNVQNPAAPAVRTPYSDAHFDYDVGLSLTFPSTIANTDFFNSGKRSDIGAPPDDSFLFFGLAVNLTFGPWGFGIASNLQNYNLDRSQNAAGESRDALTGQVAANQFQVAHAFADGELVVGVGLRSVALEVVSVASEDTPLFTTVGLGYEAGFVWKPNHQQFRLGATLRSSVTTEVTPGSQRVLFRDDPENELWLPDRVALPWELNFGAAVQFGPRPLNPRFIDPKELTRKLHRYLAWRTRERERRKEYELRRATAEGRDVRAVREAFEAEASVQQALDEATLKRAQQEAVRALERRYASLERSFLLLTTSLLVSGPVDEAVGVESFLERRVQRSGEKVSFSPRAAVETELIPHYTRVRVGSYYEPTRFAVSKGDRVHLTLGLDQKLFPWSVFGIFAEGTEWRVTGALDHARDYFGWGVAAGVWH